MSRGVVILRDGTGIHGEIRALKEHWVYILADSMWRINDDGNHVSQGEWKLGTAGFNIPTRTIKWVECIWDEEE